MIGRYTVTCKQANLFFPLFSFFFLFYTNENSLPRLRRAVFVLQTRKSLPQRICAAAGSFLDGEGLR